MLQSIETNKGIIHPIIVNKTTDGRYVVIEGNTRLVIYRHFKKENRPGDWNVIPSIVYDQMDDVTKDSIRLQAHLVGTREWDPYSKAKYLDFLRNKEHLPFNRIIDFCGGNTREIQNYIAAYKDMETHYRPLTNDNDFDATRFSAFVELQASRVLDSLKTHSFAKGDFAKWVHERKLYPLQTVRQLPRILNNPRSKEAFLRNDAQEAIKLLDTNSQTLNLSDATLMQLAKELVRKINSLNLPDIIRLRGEVNSEEKDSIQYATETLSGLWNEIKGNN